LKWKIALHLVLYSLTFLLKNHVKGHPALIMVCGACQWLVYWWDKPHVGWWGMEFCRCVQLIVEH